MNNEEPTNGIDENADEHESRAVLEPFASVLGTEAVWAERPTGLDESIVEQIRAASVFATRDAEAGPAVVRAIRPRRLRSWATPALAAAAAVAAFAAGFVVADRDDSGGNGVDEAAAIADVDLVGTALAPGAAATGEVIDRGAGLAIRLDVAGLPPAAEGGYYEGWLRAEDGAMVSVGTFHMRNGDSPIVLWSGVGLADYETLVVTEETERADEAASDRVVLEGLVEPR